MKDALVVESVDAPDSKSGTERCVGSSPTQGTNLPSRINIHTARFSIILPQGYYFGDPQGFEFGLFQQTYSRLVNALAKYQLQFSVVSASGPVLRGAGVRAAAIVGTIDNPLFILVLVKKKRGATQKTVYFANHQLMADLFLADVEHGRYDEELSALTLKNWVL